MPNPLIAVSFTPKKDGKLIATATYSVQQTGTASDWGGADPGTWLRLMRNSDSAILETGAFYPCTRTRMSQVNRQTFTVLSSNGAQTVGLHGTGGAPGTAVLTWDLDLTAELIKK